MVKVVHTEAFNGFSHMRSTLLSALQNAILPRPPCKCQPLLGAFGNRAASSSREGSGCFF